MPSRLSTEYWKIPVRGTVNGAAVDPTVDQVFIAVLTSSTAVPADTDWKPASWESTSSGHVARILVGPNGGDLDFSQSGPTWTYVWVKVGDDPETPVLAAGPMLVS